MADNSAEKYMKMALALARRGRGKTSPNPMVGAVVVKGGEVVGRGYHHKAGQAHAEVLALKDAAEKAQGATLYVNLEPCCHFGRTRPCTEAIIEAGIKRVVFSIKDPNPLVNGCGARKLRSVGIEVISGVGDKEAAHFNEIYLKYIATGRPFVILKTAQSLDGRIATITGDSKWISGPEGLEFAHRLRAECDEVAVGAGTVKADDPQLTVRLVKGRNPYRIIISRHPDFPRGIHLFKDNADARTIVATTKSAAARIKQKNIITWVIREDKAGLSLIDFLETAGKFGIQSLLVEGGGRLATSLLKERLVDRHHLMIAPLIIGSGKEGVGEMNVRHLSKAFRYREYSFSPCGSDILFTGYPKDK